MASDLNAVNSFPVFDTSGSVNYFLKNIEANKQKRAQEQKAIQADLEAVKIDGIRDADRNDYFKGYEDWRNVAQQAYGERDFKKKAELQAAAAQKKMELQNFVNQSKQYGKDYRDFKGRLLDDRLRDQFSDDALEQVQAADKVSIRDPKFIKDFTTLGRKVDLSKVDDQFAKLDADLLGKQQESNPVAGAPIKAGNRRGTTLTYSTTVDPKAQIFNYGMMYDANKDVKAYVQQKYADLFANNPEEQAKALAIQDLVKNRPLQKVRQTPVWDDMSQENYRANRDYAVANPTRAEKSGEQEVIFRQKWIDDMINRVPNSGERLKAIVEARPEYKEKLGINFVGDKINLNIPDKTIESVNQDGKVAVKVIPGRKITVDISGPGAKSKLNKLVSELTGEEIKESKFATGQASGKIKGEVVSAAPVSKSTPAKTKGMVTVVMPNGQAGQIPADKVEAFMKKYPKAKKQ